MLRSDCVLQKKWKERPKRIFWTMVQLAFTWCFPILKICSRKVLPRNHRSSMGEKCSCDFWDMLVCGVPCGKAVNYQTTAVPSISGTWILAPTSCISFSYKGATPTRSNDFQTRKCKHPVCAPGERSSSRRPLLRRSGWAISGAFSQAGATPIGNCLQGKFITTEEPTANNNAIIFKRRYK